MANYLDNDAFESEIREAVASGKASDELVAMISVLTENLVKTYASDSQESEDISQEAIMLALQKLGNFNPEKGSKAFNYFTTVILNKIRAMTARARQRNRNEVAYRSLIQQTNEFLETWD